MIKFIKGKLTRRNKKYIISWQNTTCAMYNELQLPYFTITICNVLGDDFILYFATVNHSIAWK